MAGGNEIIENNNILLRGADIHCKGRVHPLFRAAERDIFIKRYAEKRGYAVGDELSEVALKVSAFRGGDYRPASGSEVIAEDIGEKRGGGPGNFRYHGIVGLNLCQGLAVNAPFPNGEEETPGAVGSWRRAQAWATPLSRS